MKILFFSLLLLNFTGCGMFTANRTFISEMDNDTDGFFVAERDFNVTSGDSGQAYRTLSEIRDRTPASKMEKDRYLSDAYLEEELTDLEAKLSYNELSQYQAYKEKLATVSEKIYFLKLRGFQEKEEYLIGKGLKKENRDDFSVSSAVSVGDIIVGMDKSSVIKSWGRPNRVDIAGDPAYQNERWAFYRNGRLKYIFFERGVVNGWTEQ
ncbi:MAG: hypothetical protein U0T83_00395 [Bacteriovoracaceae bacterium]